MLRSNISLRSGSLGVPATSRTHSTLPFASRGLSSLLLTLPLLLLLANCTEQGDPLAPFDVPEAPSLLVPVPGHTQLSAGAFHTCALRGDGTVTCWGGNDDGQSTVPVGLAGVVQVSAGLRHTCAVDLSGTLTCWGSNAEGRLDAPSDLTEVKQVSAGFNSTCAVDGNRMVVCWGANTTGHYTTPDDLGPVDQVLAGYQYACARRTDGTARCWGDRNEPEVDDLTGVTDLGSGAYHACASTSDGTVTCWGGNTFGAINVPNEIAVGAIADVTHVSSGEYHNCAHRGAGTIICWGANGDGRSTVPPGLADVMEVSAGYYHTCVLKTDGRIICWGQNDYGQTDVPTVREFPAATFNHPSTVTLGDGIALSLTGAHVPGFAGTPSFTFAFDCGDGNGYGPYGADNTALCTSGELGERTVKGKVRDEDGDLTEYTGTVATVYAFTGFLAPVDNNALNQVRAGQAVPIKFSLGGDQGLDVLAAGSPASHTIACTTAGGAGTITETVTAGNSGLSYDPATQTYTYVWKTSRAWANSCRRLAVAFADGAAPRTADFEFTR